MNTEHSEHTNPLAPTPAPRVKAERFEIPEPLTIKVALCGEPTVRTGIDDDPPRQHQA